MIKDLIKLYDSATDLTQVPIDRQTARLLGCTSTWIIILISLFIDDLLLRMFVTHPPWRPHFNHMGGHLPLEDHIKLPRFVKHTATVFRFLDKCVGDLDNPIQTVENFRLVTRIHALQGLGIKDFVIIKGSHSSIENT